MCYGAITSSVLFRIEGDHMKPRHEMLHEKALELVKNFKQSESQLLNILMEIDQEKAYLPYACNSLFQYALRKLDLTEAQAYAFITVSRTAKKIPELKEKIEAGEVT